MTSAISHYTRVQTFINLSHSTRKECEEEAKAILTELHKNDERYYPMPTDPIRSLLETYFDHSWKKDRVNFDTALERVNQCIPEANTLTRKARIFFQIQCPRSIKKKEVAIVLGIPLATTLCLALSIMIFTHPSFLGPKVNTHLISRIQPFIGEMIKHCPPALLSLGNHPIVAAIYQTAANVAAIFLAFCTIANLSSIISHSIHEKLTNFYSYRATKIALIASVILLTVALHSALPAVLFFATVFAIQAFATGILAAGITNAWTGLRSNLTKIVKWIENKGLENEKILCEEIQQQLRTRFVKDKLEQLPPSIVVV